MSQSKKCHITKLFATYRTQTNASIITTLTLITFLIQWFEKGFCLKIIRYFPFFIRSSLKSSVTYFLTSEPPYLKNTFTPLSAPGFRLFLILLVLSLIVPHKTNLSSHPRYHKLVNFPLYLFLQLYLGLAYSQHVLPISL